MKLIFLEQTVTLITANMSDEEFNEFIEGGEACTTESGVNYLKFEL